MSDTFTLGPLGFATSLEELMRWFADAVPGSSAVYASGFTCPREHASVVQARRWSEAGAAVLYQRRDPHDPRRYQYFIRKCDPASASRQVRSARRPVADAPRPDLTREQMRYLMKRLRKIAHDGDPCPSHGDLAKELCLTRTRRARRRVGYLLERLTKERQIAIEPGSATRTPVVTILAAGRAQGKSTKAVERRPTRGKQEVV